MLKLLFILAIGLGGLIQVSCVSDPAPIPIPYLDFQRMLGTWYGIWSYGNLTIYPNASCWTNDVVQATDGTIVWNASIFNSDNETNTTLNFTVANSQGSVWNTTNSSLIWMAVDPVNYNWGLGALGNYLFAVGRTRTLDKSIIQAQVSLAKKEGYSMDLNLTVFYNNTNCTQSIMF